MILYTYKARYSLSIIVEDEHLSFSILDEIFCTYSSRDIYCDSSNIRRLASYCLTFNMDIEILVKTGGNYSVS